MNTQQSYFQMLQSGLVSQGPASQINIGFLSEKAKDFQQRISDALINETPVMVPIANLDDDGYVPVVDLQYIDNFLDSPDVYVSVRAYNADGTDYKIKRLTGQQISDGLLAELDVARLEAEIIPLLAGNLNAEDSPGLITSIQNIMSTATTAAGRTMGQVLNKLSAVSPTPSDFAKASVEYMSSTEGSQPFNPTRMGVATGTCGLLLWSSMAATTVADWVIENKETILKVITTIPKYILKAGTWYSKAISLVRDLFAYRIDDLFNDEFIYANDTEAQDLSLSNCFTVVKTVTDTSFINAAASAGVSESSAMAIPTLGATWYIYLENGNTKIGMVKHLYSQESASKILAQWSADGNDFQDLIALGATPEPHSLSTTGYSQVSQFNLAASQALVATEKLISAGLISLSYDTISGRYYQEYDPPRDYRGIFTLSQPSSITTRKKFIQEATYAGNAATINFVESCLKRYLLQVQGLETELYWHVPVTTVLSGAYLAGDDAVTVDEMTTSVRNFAIAAGVVASVALAAFGLYKLKVAATNAVTAAVRAINDPSASLDTVRKLKRKADFLSAVAGVTTGFTASTVGEMAVATTGRYLDEGVTSQNDKLQRIHESIVGE